MMRVIAVIAAALLAAALNQYALAQSGAPRPPAAKPNRVAAPAEKTAPGPTGPPPDMAYGAFQRGYFLTAFSLATDRVTNGADPKALTLLGELYAGGLGVPRDHRPAAEWYGLAPAPGAPKAIFPPPP